MLLPPPQPTPSPLNRNPGPILNWGLSLQSAQSQSLGSGPISGSNTGPNSSQDTRSSLLIWKWLRADHSTPFLSLVSCSSTLNTTKTYSHGWVIFCVCCCGAKEEINLNLVPSQYEWKCFPFTQRMLIKLSIFFIIDQRWVNILIHKTTDWSVVFYYTVQTLLTISGSCFPQA